MGFPVESVVLQTLYPDIIGLVKKKKVWNLKQQKIEVGVQNWEFLVLVQNPAKTIFPK